MRDLRDSQGRFTIPTWDGFMKENGGAPMVADAPAQRLGRYAREAVQTSQYLATSA